MKRREAVKIISRTASGLFLARFVTGCKNIFGPSDPASTKTEDVIEFMYERTLPIISPNESDTKGCNIWSYVFAGFTIYWEQQVAPNQWTCQQALKYTSSPYYFYLIDGKVISEYTHIARTVFARIRGQANWIQLTAIENNFQVEGEWTKFLLDKNGIHIPSSSSFSR